MPKTLPIGITLVIVFAFQVLSAQTETAASCNTTSVYGRVLSSVSTNPVPKSWAVSITATAIGSGDRLDRRESQGDMYCLKIPLHSKASLIFEQPSFDPQIADDVEATLQRRHSFALPVMKLNPIGHKRGQGTTEGEESVGEIRATLDKHRDVFRASRSRDIFVWNIASYKAIYSDRREVLDEIERFVSEVTIQPEFAFLSTEEFKSKSRLFTFIIAQNHNQPAAANISIVDLIHLLDDMDVASAIRVEVVDVLATLGTADNAVQLRAVFGRSLVQDSAAMVREHAARLLGKVGGEESLVLLKRAAEDDDSSDVRRAALEASQSVTARRPKAESPCIPSEFRQKSRRGAFRTDKSKRGSEGLFHHGKPIHS